VSVGAQVPTGAADWETCRASAGCRGAALPEAGNRCLAHLRREDEFRTYLARSQQLDGRGVEVDAALWHAIVAELPRDADGHAVLELGNFERGAFADDLILDGVVFGPGTSFEGANFGDGTSFEHTVFGDKVTFRRAKFGERVSFHGAEFGRHVSFVEATFAARVKFDDAVFADGPSFVGRTRFGPLASFAGTTFGAHARFDDATFDERASFRKAIFGPNASMRKTTFGNKAWFEEASFGDEVSFNRAVFADDASFVDAKFGDGVSFREAQFGTNSGFHRASFGDRTWFSAAKFGSGTNFTSASFSGHAGFSDTGFSGTVKFDDVTFCGRVRFDRATFHGRASFRLSTFERARNFGPVIAHGLLTLEQASFIEAATIQVCANRLALVRASFPEGVELQVRFAEVALDLASFGSPSLLTGATPFLDLDESELVQSLEPRSETPCVVTVRGANVADLTMANVDLGRCRFVAAHNLDRLRLESDVSLPTTPKWRTTRRRFIAEEQEWRANQLGRSSASWKAPERAFAVERVARTRVLHPREIAAIYRALRKGREDERDSPGAADFYYGEMEMRRLDASATRSERALIWLYWASAGYGLRGLRALIALVATVLVFAALLRWVGFTPRPTFVRALLFSAESTSSLFRVPQTPDLTLTDLGEALQITLRLLGPLFFGLALLSLRGRVKR
jgi:hypothetical protein